MRKKLGAAVVGLAVAGVSLLATGSASSHGYTDQPISRQKLCANGTVTNCGAIQYEPQSVEGPKGFPGAGPADGKICSGQHDTFGELDGAKAPNGNAWPTTQLTGGQGYTFRWQFTARHATTDFEYFITKNGWDDSKPLTRADLDPQPFMTVPYGNRQPPGTVEQQGTIPTQKTGHHVILAVWNIADTGNAFYACSDVNF
ncbi:lytic polysaccharide monooxygenase [Streptomyces sp. NBC_01387]|uniref:lytic polysaccharide monooxygenase auxiliary activity family 9 protein n=1 Tax=unclassified Streptomyces TaxID=2593676 RepID=UPI002024738B|nr:MULTISPECIES: lytic polysaccharide monooxygenase [unclassified Streptomyces]MCX4550928.1 lytic polysaccharide monooxygenase [Streptomyces sp. NBC_01500]WSC22351.1 lytic polysaccharide monooxygenase [Streptomyces sp. NBC_01766]WSV56194.1 lytic polysaccharide monooxygenase [Streptomyces sp. NBC_01014]